MLARVQPVLSKSTSRGTSTKGTATLWNSESANRPTRASSCFGEFFTKAKARKESPLSPRWINGATYGFLMARYRSISFSETANKLFSINRPTIASALGNLRDCSMDFAVVLPCFFTYSKTASSLSLQAPKASSSISGESITWVSLSTLSPEGRAALKTSPTEQR